jgi:hypothetical protein
MLREVQCYDPYQFRTLIYSEPDLGNGWTVFCVIPDMPRRMLVLLTSQWPRVQ